MNSCNVRGFLQIGGGDIAVVKKLKGHFTPVSGGYAFQFSDLFDAFQNGIITLRNSSALDLYLKNEKCNELVCLGTTDYTLFPNTAFPLSYPFFSFRNKNSFLFINSERSDLIIEIEYEAIVLKTDFKSTLVDKSLPYCSLYHIPSRELYSYEKDDIHKPFKVTIEY